MKKMDPLVISILENKNKNVDRDFTAIQNRLFITMGPLVHLWLTLDKINNSSETTPNLDDSAHEQLYNIDIRQLINLVEKTICCLGQTNVTIIYQRRTSALVKVTRDPSKDKSVLRNKHDILAKSEDLLFGNDFKSDLKGLSELKKEASKMTEALGAKPNNQKRKVVDQDRQNYFDHKMKPTGATHAREFFHKTPFQHKPSFQGQGTIKGEGKDHKDPSGYTTGFSYVRVKLYQCKCKQLRCKHTRLFRERPFNLKGLWFFSKKIF
jgi:hypothetical protein